MITAITVCKRDIAKMKKPLTVLLSTCLLAIPGVAAAQAEPDGAALFRQRCASCHVAAPNATVRLAPNLVGIVGRKAGKVPGFNYSPALKASTITWTRASLNQFLQAPMRMVPGTRMVISVPDAAQRAAIVAYLARPAR